MKKYYHSGVLKKLFALLLPVVLGCAHASNSAMAFRLHSSTFEDGKMLPDRTVLNGLDCHGANVSPSLDWSNAPAGTKSFAAAAGVDVANGGRHAYNDFLRHDYSGPCPPEGPPHKYRFTVYALDLPSIDDAGTPMTWRKLRFIIRGHVLAEASLTGLRGH